MAWNYSYDTAYPPGSAPPSILDDVIRELKQALAERLAIDHSFDLAGGIQTSTNGGKHVKVTLLQTTKPTAAATTGFLYAKDVGGTTELFFEDAAGNEKQITSAGKLNIAITDIADALLTGAKIQLANNTYLKATDFAGTGTVDLIKANASNKPVLPDASQLATSAVPTADADIANKKYVDDQIDTRRLGPIQTTDSLGNAFTNGSVYLAQCDGVVTWNDEAVNGNSITGLVGTSNPPTYRVAYWYNSSLNTRTDCRSFEVAAGEYVKVTDTSGVISNMYWRPRGTGYLVEQ
jgi:hypothetical protein